jgi:Uma2 family endonuclease
VAIGYAMNQGRPGWQHAHVRRPIRRIDRLPARPYDEHMTEYAIQTRRFTRAEYDHLIDIGFFQPGDPVELLGGQLVVSEPHSAYHYGAIRKAARALEPAFGPGWDVRMQAPVWLDDDSEPEPDVAVVRGRFEDYFQAHPARPVLTVEVSDSRLGFDRRHKGSLYARAGLADYWVVNLVERVLEVYREPVPDAEAPFGWRYARREVLGPTDAVMPLAAPGAIIRVADLLP